MPAAATVAPTCASKVESTPYSRQVDRAVMGDDRAEVAGPQIAADRSGEEVHALAILPSCDQSKQDLVAN